MQRGANQGAFAPVASSSHCSASEEASPELKREADDAARRQAALDALAGADGPARGSTSRSMRAPARRPGRGALAVEDDADGLARAQVVHRREGGAPRRGVALGRQVRLRHRERDGRLRE